MRRKIYGQSRIETCPFCAKRALFNNSQGIAVCREHRYNKLMPRCVCGELLEIRKGKWGPYFFCMNCGNISYRKGIDMNSETPRKPESF